MVQWVKDRHCHRCGLGSIPDLGTSTCHACGQEKKKKYKYIVFTFWKKKKARLLVVDSYLKKRNGFSVMENT